MKKFATFLLPFIALAPALASAQLTGTSGLIHAVGGLVNYLLVLLTAIALLAFLWGLVKFIFRAGDVAEKEKGKSVMVWGLIALFVLVSVWGIIGFFQKDLGLTVTTSAGNNLPPGSGSNNNNNNNGNEPPCGDSEFQQPCR